LEAWKTNIKMSGGKRRILPEQFLLSNGRVREK
jgi:hypothetical protein